MQQGKQDQVGFLRRKFFSTTHLTTSRRELGYCLKNLCAENQMWNKHCCQLRGNQGHWLPGRRLLYALCRMWMWVEAATTDKQPVRVWTWKPGLCGSAAAEAEDKREQLANSHLLLPAGELTPVVNQNCVRNVLMVSATGWSKKRLKLSRLYPTEFRPMVTIGDQCSDAFDKLPLATAPLSGILKPVASNTEIRTPWLRYGWKSKRGMGDPTMFDSMNPFCKWLPTMHWLNCSRRSR